MKIFKGCATALVTPFKDGKVDYNAMNDLINWQIASGIDGLVILGTTGEASTLSIREKIEIVTNAKKQVSNRVPLIVGTGSNDTESSLLLSKEIGELGVDGLLIVTPYYNKCSQIGLIKHYEHIANSVNTPIILYSVKSRTGVNIEPETVKELSEHKNIVGIKEASGDISQICKIASQVKEDFAIYSGNDDQVIPIMSLGGLGVISTVSNIVPNQMSKLAKLCLKNLYKDALSYQLDLKELIDYMFKDINPIPVKTALYQMGKINLEYRMPLCEPTDKLKYEIYSILKKSQLIP